MINSIYAIAMATLFTMTGIKTSEMEKTITPVLQKTETWNKNQVIAHRGAWKKKSLPENSIASLNEAIKLGCHGSEFDVQMTLDSILVVNHDDDFLGMTIASHTYKELLEKKLSNGESIPTLEAYLKAGKKQKGTKLILELKPSKISQERDLQMTSKALSMVKKLHATPWVDYISFSYPICLEILSLQPGAKVAYLNGDASLEKLKEAGFYGADYHFSVYKNNDWFTNAKAIGLTLNAWTVNSETEMNRLLDQHIEFITTNEPELLFDLLKSRK
ncbi:glycerophosphodiester phosphodiesterase [Pedobacter sp. PACM 27299]|uniref:glycerophosphodiester phosphodiesterase n=1 Tax=Pedobacter sp. PACM 27299 TaxID=1727164 RepID=UPI000A96DC74|nr:glycerophosphodiester phosphodiesterase family protein [Pedobacter sp. PACM 27299]